MRFRFRRSLSILSVVGVAALGLSAVSADALAPTIANCAIQSEANHRWVSAELGYTGALKGMLRARASKVGPWEKFQCVRSDPLAIRSTANKLWVATELGYTGSRYAMLAARSGSPAIREQFKFEAVRGCACVAIVAGPNGRYVSAEVGYRGSMYGMLRARATKIGPWERFKIVALGPTVTGISPNSSSDTGPPVTVSVTGSGFSTTPGATTFDVFGSALVHDVLLSGNCTSSSKCTVVVPIYAPGGRELIAVVHGVPSIPNPPNDEIRIKCGKSCVGL